LTSSRSLEASYSSVHASRGGRASRRWCRSACRGCRCAGRCSCAIVGARYANSRVYRRNRAIDAINCANIIKG
jgi:hypothetical protein